MKSVEDVDPGPLGIHSNVIFHALKLCSKRRIDNDDWELISMELQNYMKINGLRNGSRMRRAAPTASGFLIEPVVYEEL